MFVAPSNVNSPRQTIARIFFSRIISCSKHIVLVLKKNIILWTVKQSDENKFPLLLFRLFSLFFGSESSKKRKRLRILCTASVSVFMCARGEATLKVKLALNFILFSLNTTNALRKHFMVNRKTNFSISNKMRTNARSKSFAFVDLMFYLLTFRVIHSVDPNIACTFHCSHSNETACGMCDKSGVSFFVEWKLKQFSRWFPVKKEGSAIR